MPTKLYSQLIDILLANGCSFVRQGKGSHEIWQSPLNNARFPVAVTVKSKNTANAILRQAGISTRI